jgi:hypothetical protein
MRFKMPGAYGLVPTTGTGQSQWGTPTLTTATLAAIQSGTPVAETASIRSGLRSQWRGWKVETFIMGPGANALAAQRFVSWVIGQPPVHTHGVYVWYGVERAVGAA